MASAGESPRDGIARQSRAADVFELAKPGIVKMVVLTAGIGFALAAVGRSWEPLVLARALIGCIVGTALSAAGANALNQALEWARDAAMARTRQRPVPAGRMGASRAATIGMGLTFVGIAVLWIGTGVVPALVSLASAGTYVILYTPMKPLTTFATLVGAIPGALPPLIGWTAGWLGSESAWQGLERGGGWSLFLILFVWQVPHFLAIAWKYREDYARAGHRVLPVVDRSGRSTATAMTVWTLALIAVSLSPLLTMPGRIGWLYGLAALAGGIGMLRSCLKFERSRADRDARAVFLWSIAYLPLVLLAMAVDAFVPGFSS